MLTETAPSIRNASEFSCMPLTLELGGRRCRQQVEQHLVVPELVEREVDDLLRGELRVQVGFLRLEERGLAHHVDALRQGADLELQVEPDGVARRDPEPGLPELPEPRE